MRPQLAGSEVTQSMMDTPARTPRSMLPPVPAGLKPVAWVVNKVLRAATIATMPHWMRKMAGLRQPRLLDALRRR